MEAFPLYIAVAVFLYVFTKHFLGKIQNLPPSPFPSLPILGHLYLLKKPLQRTLAKISGRYGPVVLLQFGSRRVLVVSSPSAAEECLNKNGVVFANRPRLVAGKHLGYNYTSLASTSYGDHWRNLRRISSLEILSSHRLQSLHAIRVDEVRSMARRLFAASSRTDEAVDMKAVFFELTLNVMMRMIAGKRYYGENVQDAEEAVRFREIAVETFLLGGATNIGDFLPALRWVGGMEKKLMVLQEKRDRFMKELVDQERTKMNGHHHGGIGSTGDGSERERRRETMIEVLLSLQQTEPDYYSDEIIRSLMLVNLSFKSKF